MVAAIKAKNENNRVILIEKNDRIGKKLLATGNGRCNYTNLKLSTKNYSNGNFVKETLDEFNNDDLINFFKFLGLESTTDGDRVYPITLKANTVLNILMYWLESKGVEIMTSTEVKSFEKIKNKFLVHTNNKDLECDKLVCAFGASSMPASGSDGTAFKILKEHGIKVTDLYPALTQLKLDSKYLKHLSGTKVIGEAKLIRDGKIIDRRRGDLLFTNYGISGPPILDLSVNARKNDIIEIPLINNVDKNIKEMLYSRFYIFPDFSVKDFLIGIVDKKFIHYIVDALGLDKNSAMSALNIKDFDRIVDLLLQSKFKVIGNTGFKNSQVTRGGVSLDEVNSFDYSSKKIKDLYIIGEALDIDGDCGGYNLHFAIASGYRLGAKFSG